MAKVGHDRLLGEGKGETQSHRVGTNEKKKAFVSSKGKMTPMSRNVQFGWFTASNPGREETVKKKVKLGTEEGKGTKNWVVQRKVVLRRVVLEGCPGTQTKENKKKHDKLIFLFEETRNREKKKMCFWASGSVFVFLNCQFCAASAICSSFVKKMLLQHVLSFWLTTKEGCLAEAMQEHRIPKSKKKK